MCGSRRRHPLNTVSSRRHRHADLDEDTSIHWQQLADRSQRGGESRNTARQGWRSARRRKLGVLFLVSDVSRYMTDGELVIDGGMTGGARPRWS
jgi:hypothetical protein